MGNNGVKTATQDGETCEFKYLMVKPCDGSLTDLFHFLVSGAKSYKFLKTSKDENEGERGLGPISGDHRLVILVSILVRRIIAAFGKPMEWCGILVEFLLNLLLLNGGLRCLFFNLFSGKVGVPKRGSETFISVIGHLDRRINLHKFDSGANKGIEGSFSVGSRALIDLCMMASKLAYENNKVIAHVVTSHWKMHFVKFYNCWNDYQKELSTQVFILCDKPKDANIVLISFRGTELFDSNDWSTDIDYSWYEIPHIGKIHMGFLEALGLGNRDQVYSFQFHLQGGNSSKSSSFDIAVNHDTSSDLDRNKENAYYCIRSKLKTLLHENKNAEFIVTGHSLGGALAVLFPAILVFHKEEELLKKLLGVYTFGQPRVGDQQFVRFMEAHLCHPVPKYLRMVYCNDLVPRLPYDNKTFLYKHFGTCAYYNSLYIEKDVEEEPDMNYFGLRYFLPQHLNAVWELIRSLTMGYKYGKEYKETWFSILLRVCGVVVPGLSAHCPANYINSIRLGRAATDTRRSS
ncbi:hypothetical protein Cni_G17269 [Canna indica]|uniref:Fungal lipase-type domain-containing protein n=1 Tax=Canna indica TaxID=4628 RepID=A0AAQ3KMD1_9LILI|nr:hypothetical protein Cni_G17269 [Canna indica]